MKKSKVIVTVLTVMFLALFVALEMILIQRESFPFSVRVVSEENSQTLSCIRRNGCYYVFLPSYADLDQVEIAVNPMFPVWIDGKRVKDGTSCGDFSLEEEITVTAGKFGRRYNVPLVFLRGDGIPALFIDTTSGSMEYIHTEKGNSESGNLRLYREDGNLEADTRLEAIGGRGNSTWEAPKKPYRIELRQPENLLDMGAGKKWILLANYYEASNICNKMVYEFASKVGDLYAPQCRWVDLYLNGNYAGLYLLTERNEVDPQRVDISETGSFLLSMELAERWVEAKYPAFLSDRDIFFRVHHGGMPLSQIQSVWQSAEDAVYAADGIDPVTGNHWTELMDLESWARQWLLCEVFDDFDAGALSQFVYYEEGNGKIFAGPVWDMDHILNRTGHHYANILPSERKYLWSTDRESIFYTLSQKEEFRQEVKRQYWEVFRPLLISLAQEGMDAYLSQCCGSAQMNRVRWSDQDPAEEVERMKAYLLDHMAFLEAYWAAEEEYCLIDVKPDNQWRTFAVLRGESAAFLNELPLREGLTEDSIWRDCQTGEIFDPSTPVLKKRVILKREEY